MTLMMYLGNDFIEAVPLNNWQISEPGYLGGYKRLLKQKHALLLQASPEPPEFLVVNESLLAEACNDFSSNTPAVSRAATTVAACF